MTSELKSDRIKIVIKLKQPVTYAGQYLQGSVNLNVLQDTEYKEINISLIGHQAISWSAQLGKSITSYQNKKETYKQEFILSRFDQMLKKGQYQFPFNILLPSSLPASMFINATNHITYNLKAFLPSSEEKGEPLGHQISLNIRQPLRMIDSLSQYGTSTSQCWKCLGKKQSGIFHIQLEKNELRSGQAIKVKGFIDNTNGDFSIDTFQLTLTRSIVKVAANGTSQTTNEDIATLIQPKKGVSRGAQKKFEAEVRIPDKMTQYTAIGNIIARTFFISLVGQVGCFYSSVRIQKHIFLNNINGVNNDNKKLQIQSWNPKTSPSISFIALKPYIFSHSPQIKICNQKGNAVLSSKLPQHSSIQNIMKGNDL